MGSVYMLVSPENGLVKIGFTAGHPQKRYAEIRSMCGTPLFRWGYFEGEPADENRLHDRFHRYRSHGEWYRLAGKVFDFVSARHGSWWADGMTDYEHSLVSFALSDRPDDAIEPPAILMRRLLVAAGCECRDHSVGVV